MNPNFTVCLCKAKKTFWFFQPTQPMHQFQKLLISCIVLFTSALSAQYTGVINSNRPGFSESPYSVGTGVYQLETSIFYRNTGIHPTFSLPQSRGADFLFRTSFLKEKLEFNVNFAYQKDKVAFRNIFTSSYFTSGFSKFIVAGKYLIYEQKYKNKSEEVRSWVERHSFDWKRLIPSVAGYVGVNVGIVNDIHATGGFSPKVGVLLQNDLSKELNVVTNIFYDRIGTDLPEFSYIITATYSINDRWSTFFENQTFSNKFEYRTNLGSGLAFLYNKNIQINSSLRLLANPNSSGFYTSIGASYRFDRHKDEMIELDENGKPIEDEEDGSVKKKGFFGKLLSKATGIFKKKGKRIVDGNTTLKKKTIESIKKNTNKDEITINNDSLQVRTVKPIRTRPKRARVRPSKIKPVKKKRKGGLFGIFKGKSAADKEKARKEKDAKNGKKSVDKQLRLLDKEQKKLEKEQKREEARRKREEAKKKKKEEKKKKKDDSKKEDENG